MKGDREPDELELLDDRRGGKGGAISVADYAQEAHQNIGRT